MAELLGSFRCRGVILNGLYFAFLRHSLFVKECVLCQCETPNFGLCQWCFPLLEAREEPKCSRCDGPRVAGNGPAWCAKCVKNRPSFERAWGVFEYSGPAGELVNLAKFQAQTRAATVLAHHLASTLPPALLADPPKRVCPMPLHPRRVRRRGINLPLILSVAVAKALNRPLSRWRLCRVRDTPPQRGLSAAERRMNVRNAFGARGVGGDDILLIDDVLTTGASAEAVSQTALRSGCARVRVIAATYVAWDNVL